MRQMMLLVDFVTAFCGSSVSPAARVAISEPMKEKTTSSTPGNCGSCLEARKSMTVEAP